MAGAGRRTETKGLFRARFGGAEETVSAVFRHLAGTDLPRQVDDRLRLSQTRADLPEDEGGGFWRFLSLAEGLYAILTDCRYANARTERVVAEGMVEFHFLLEGPVELSLPKGADTNAADVSFIACQQAQGLDYEVVCQPGVYRMLSLYVRPDILENSFGMDGGATRQLLHPEPGTMAMREQKIDLDFLRVLRELFGLEFAGPRDLPLAAARITELLVLSVDALDRRGRAEEESVVFTARELAMFDRARQILSTDFSESLTIPGLARTLGTNATKLKSGFRLLYGATIFNYRNRYRMDRAMQLLVAGRMPIAAVAHEVGFRHQASFTSAFRAHFGLTPKQARQRVATPEGTPKDD